MKQRIVRFERDPSLDGVEVVIRAPEQDADVTALMAQLGAAPPGKFTVFDGYGSVFVLPEEEIILIAAEGRLVSVVTESGRYYMRQSLKNMETVLDPQRFVRISRYEIVNLAMVQRYDFTLAGTLQLELTGGYTTNASRRCIPLIRKRLMGKE